ncbi:MAG TPA: DUF2207 domain-containing protein [Candidatus Dormibacteraeota bacterium]|nr:DUF2207 domain-containing protein [Candidatus Dormibacteraeota bacterium]
MVVLTCAVARAQDGERITDYRSDIAVDRDGWLTVTETIAVVAAGESIKRGIYRDFPTSYEGPLGTRVEVPFDVVGIERDGHPEPYHTQDADNGVRIYIGQEDVEIPLGPHIYRITYRTGQQLGFFADHDELYWNVTGNGWSFPIDRATANVTLPADVPGDRVALEGYTGWSGSTERALTTAVDRRSGALRFATTRPLDAYEGLTIVASFPKGYVHEPTAAERRDAWLHSNRHLVAGAAGLALVLFYYLTTWLAVGRDPSRGTIIPLFEPPLGLDAPGVRYVAGMGYDERCFTAALVSLGVKGWLRIEEKDGAFTLTRRSGRQTALSVPERLLNRALLGNSESLELEQKNHGRVRAAIDALRGGLAAQYEGAMFRANQRWLRPGLALSVAALLALGWYGPRAGSIGMAFIMVWLGFWTFACLSLFENVRRGWRDAARPGIGTGSRVFAVILAVIVTAFALPFFAGEAFGLFALGQFTSMWAIPLLLLLAVVNWVFSYLLKQPTSAGRLVMDQIDGFRMYLSTAEGDELRQAPARTPELFESMLPFAIALGVEHAWSERFAEVLKAAAAQGGNGTGPLWYSGQSWDQLGASQFSSIVGSSLSSAVSSSSVAPGSSSGSSGGGSSGGGGGGGGGGGW